MIRSIERTADGFRVTRSNGTMIVLTSADIPSNVKSQPIATVQTWVNNWLVTNGYNGVCRIRSVTPLDTDVAIGNAGVDLSHALDAG